MNRVFGLCFIGMGFKLTVMRLYFCLVHPLLRVSGKDKTMKTPIEFDYDLWTTEEGKCMVHMDEKTPHLHLVFVPLTKDNRLCAKEIIGNRANLTKWQDDFHACMVEQYPDLERGESASKTGRKHIPTRLFKQAVNLSKQARAIEAVLSGIAHK